MFGFGFGFRHLRSRLGGGSGAQDPLGDLLALINDPVQQSAFHDLVNAANVPPWTSVDVSNNGNDLTQSTNSRKPVQSAAGSSFDGNNDFVAQPITGGVFTVVMALSVGGADTGGTMLSDQANTIYSQYLQGNTTPNIAATRVNGVLMANKGAVYDAVHGQGEVILTVEGADFTGRTQLRLGRISGSMNATVRRAAMLDETALGADLAQARVLAAEAVALS